MELYLDSVDFKEIEEAFSLGTLAGLTTTPTFMHRQGVSDIDGTILKLAEMVPILQVEALGETADQIYQEAHRLLNVGVNPQKTVFKIPVSLQGIKACKKLTNEGFMVNIHLVYTLQQAYMAMTAGAKYVCPLVGRLQDQGHDALALVEQCVEAVNYYSYDTKIMFSSVRHAEHVRNAINMGVHACTIPWNVMKNLTENNFTKAGTQQFVEHTRLMTVKVKDIISKENCSITLKETVMDAIIRMSESGIGAVPVLDEDQKIVGIFTDGDLRRHLKEEGRSALQKTMGEFEHKTPVSIAPDALLFQSVELFKKYKVDNLIVSENNELIGMLDIQDLIKLNLMG